jgi:hypothetical protein
LHFVSIGASRQRLEFFVARQGGGTADKSGLGQDMNSEAVTAAIPSVERARVTAIGNDALAESLGLILTLVESKSPGRRCSSAASTRP